MKENNLSEGPILRHLKNLAIPASIGLFFNTMFNVVDTFYAGRLSSDALAGLSLSFPIFFIVIALSSGIGSGTTALASIALGEKNQKQFHAYILNALLLAFLLGLVVMSFAPWLTRILFEFTGASGEPLALGIAYTNMILYGNLLFIFNFVLNGFLNAQGDTKSYRNFLVVGFVLNILLDPLLMFGFWHVPALGVAGIALATIAIQLLGVFYLAYRVYQSNAFDFKRFKQVKLKITLMLSILRQGIPASLSMATIAIGVYIINYFVMLYGGAEAVAGYGAAIRIEQLVLLPALGLNVATLALVGQNYGASKFERIKAIRKLATIIGLVIMAVGIVVIFPLASILMGIFSDNEAVVGYGTQYLRIEVLAFFTYVFININLAVLQGMKKPSYAIYVGIFRQFVPIGLFYFLGTILAMGIYGVWVGIVLINWLAVLLTLPYTAVMIRKKEAAYQAKA